jgi:hypothetical protein
MAQESVTISLNAIAQTQGLTSFVTGLNGIKTAAEGVGLKFQSLQGFARNALAPLVSLFSIGTLAKGFKESIDRADELGKATQKAGAASVETFSAIAFAADQSDVSLTQLTESAKGLALWMEKTGQQSKTFIETLLEQADIFAAMPDGFEKTALARERFGKSGIEMIPLLNQGSAAIKSQMDLANKFGLTVGPEFAKNAEEFNDNLRIMAGILKGEFNVAAQEALPQLVKLQDQLLSVAEQNADAIKTIVQKTVAFQVASTIGMLKLSVPLLGAMLDAQKVQTNANNRPGATDAERAEEIERIQELVALEQKRHIIAEDRQKFGVSEAALNERLTADLKEQYDLVKITADLRENNFDSTKTRDKDGNFTKEYLEHLKEVNKLLEQGASLQKEIYETHPETFFERLNKGLDELSQKFDNVGASIADVLLTGIKGAIDTVSFGLWQVIDGTSTWGQLFMQVGRNIISQLIQIAIQEILVDNIKRSIAVTWAAFKKLLMAQDVAETNAAEAAKTPALAANATLASVESWGIAVAVGVAAIAAILAGVGAFEEGGVVPGGRQLIQVNEGGTESVLNAMATRNLGTRMIDMMNAGAIGAAEIQNGFGSGLVVPSASSIESGSGSATGAGGKMTFIFVSNLEEAKEWAKSAEGEAMIVDIVRNKRMEVGIKT